MRGRKSRFTPVEYSRLSTPQKENYNFAKVSGVLADLGFVTMRLSDDWQGADFIAHHPSGRTLFVQLKSRLTISKKYCGVRAGKVIHICFPEGKHPRNWFMYRHDTMVRHMLRSGAIGKVAWRRRGGQSRVQPGKKLLDYLIRSGCLLGTEGAQASRGPRARRL